MYEIILSITLCFSDVECDNFKATSWVANEENVEKALYLCNTRKIAYMTLPYYRQGECIVEEV